MVFKPSNVLKARVNDGSTALRSGSVIAIGTSDTAQSATDKSLEALRTISEVAEEVELPQRVRRF